MVEMNIIRDKIDITLTINNQKIELPLMELTEFYVLRAGLNQALCEAIDNLVGSR